MTRVLLDARMTAGGVGRYAADLIDALSALEGGPEVVVRRASGLLDRPFTPWASRRVARAAHDSAAQIIHGLHLEVPMRSSAPCVVTIQDTIPLDHPAAMPSRLRRSLFERLLRRSLSTATLVIAPSEQTAAGLLRYGGDRRKIRVVPLGVGPVFRPCADKEREAARQRFGGGAPYVAATTSVKSHKNLNGLARAAEIVRARTGLPIVCAGALPATRGLRRVGRVDDDALRLFYGGAELFVLPSLIEGFGYPIIESLACGTQVVCGPNVGAVDHAPEGIVVADPSDPAALAGAIEALLDEARGGRARGFAVHSAVAMARATASVYDEALK